MTPFITITASV